MPSKKGQSTDASRDTADGAPRHGGRPGTRAWAQAHPTADDAAAKPQADAPDTHLQEAGGDVAGAEDNTNAATEPPSNTVGDDADAAASQARTAQRLADWLADTQDDDAWTHAAEAFSRRGIRLQRPTRSSLGDQTDAAEPDSSAAHADSRASQDEDLNLESDSEDGTPPWARQTHNASASLADGCGADTLGELEFGPKVPKTLAGGVPFPLDPRVAGSAAQHVPGHVEPALTRERTAANILMRLGRCRRSCS